MIVFPVLVAITAQLDLAVIAANDCDFERALKLTERSTEEQPRAVIRARLLTQLHRGKEGARRDRSGSKGFGVVRARGALLAQGDGARRGQAV